VDQWGVLDVSGAAMWVLSADIDCVVEVPVPCAFDASELDPELAAQPATNNEMASISTASAAAISRLSLISSLPVVVMRSTEKRDRNRAGE
jgi:hypothetical protein